tara:strand:- start:3271 stop:3489 length:219 start_codon:yes stop_codon:yes gene_type:complete
MLRALLNQKPQMAPDDANVIGFMRETLSKGEISSDALYVAIKTQFPGIDPGQIERCALRLVATLPRPQPSAH